MKVDIFLQEENGQVSGVSQMFSHEKFSLIRCFFLGYV